MEKKREFDFEPEIMHMTIAEIQDVLAERKRNETIHDIVQFILSQNPIDKPEQ